MRYAIVVKTYRGHFGLGTFWSGGHFGSGTFWSGGHFGSGTFWYGGHFGRGHFGRGHFGVGHFGGDIIEGTLCPDTGPTHPLINSGIKSLLSIVLLLLHVRK